MKRLVLLAFACSALFAQEQIDAVAAGKKTFDTMGCMECHVISPNDDSLKTGPSLFGLFLKEPRNRNVATKNHPDPVTIQADQRYLERSVRQSWDQLAIAESGATQGTAYPPAMPMYPKEVISDQDLDNLWYYLRTLAREEEAGPASVMVAKPAEVEVTSLLEIPNEIPVTSRPRIFRAPLGGSSGRALHVGLPNGMNYTFDPRTLAVRNIWTGGFLNLTEERTGRGQPGSVRGKDNHIVIEGLGILRPLTPSGDPVDFEFKEPDVRDHEAIRKWLWDDRDFPQLMASVDAEYFGHQLSINNVAPSFLFRVGPNVLTQSIDFTDDGQLEIIIDCDLSSPQKFLLDSGKLSAVEVTGGTLEGDTITLDPAKGPNFLIRAKLPTGLVARPRLEREENWNPQALVKKASEKGNAALELPAGYSIETWEAPKDLYGLDQLFEPVGIAVAKDGTIVVTTRTAGIWRIRDGKWTLFAEGTYEALGVVIEDDHGDQLVVMQKPELTRVVDTDGDGRADRFDTLCDDYGFHANYHEYAHGPVRDHDGNYYFTLNLAHGGDEQTSWRAGGPFMGSMGGYRGWACRVTPDGKFEPFANGLRSPAGLGVDPEGRLWYAENQGEYVGSSKLVPLEQGKFYGHLSGLVSLPGMKPDSPELGFNLWKDKIRKGAVWLPHGRLANSPGHPVWDLTGGKFGPFEKQIFIGDQTLSTLLRVETQQIEGIDQGFVIPFARGLLAGVMRPCFLPDGSLLIGETGRGWGARGGKQDSLQHLTYDGKTIPADLYTIVPNKEGFAVQLTRPLREDIDNERLRKALSVESWFYTNTPRYGSDENDKRGEDIVSIKLSEDRKIIAISLKDFGKEHSLDRIYHLQMKSGDLFEVTAWENLEAYYTLRAIPE